MEMIILFALLILIALLAYGCYILSEIRNKLCEKEIKEKRECCQKEKEIKLKEKRRMLIVQKS